MQGADVSDDEARQALAAYEAAVEAKDQADQARRRALDTLGAWLRKRGLENAKLSGPNKERRVKIMRSTYRSVNHEKLEALLEPEARAEIVTERELEFVRVQ